MVYDLDISQDAGNPVLEGLEVCGRRGKLDPLYSYSRASLSVHAFKEFVRHTLCNPGRIKSRQAQALDIMEIFEGMYSLADRLREASDSRN